VRRDPRRAIALFRHHFPDASSSLRVAGAVPRDPVRLCAENCGGDV